MWVVRAVCLDDLDQLQSLISLATQGLTSLQLTSDQLLDRVEQSVFAFSRTGLSPRGEPFVLVMCNDATGEIVGTSTVYAKTGGYQPFYSYRVVTSQHHSEQLGVSHTRTRLELERTHDGPTEIGSLFLRKKHRGAGRGRWLSLARFALIASRPHRFADRVIAEMRGKADLDGGVPFWKAVTGRFIPVNFSVADSMSTVCKQFIEELMPQYPIYVDLLPEEVRAGIGCVHDETKPALALLEGEGFIQTDQVDIFDAGPVVSCPKMQIGAVQRCQQATVVEVRDQAPNNSQEPLILVSDRDGFTSVMTEIERDGNEIKIGSEVARTLSIESGSSCKLLTVRSGS
ncbi:Arginine N-succinyltransferase [Rubripirellula amarantea]|uniref:Arginine N-succinyltransferase n=1 Tax=Rubripirellula amarantea TaxID=2527999 RepID=A0A5C5WTD5_9BACT|nr:arginine N-succinyltransferase [Rubripirellula amarantea]TWT53927.1 Arginine N-succinyltransferase [Rubripirellula amarantea]